jgi:LysM repeat protein
VPQPTLTPQPTLPPQPTTVPTGGPTATPVLPEDFDSTIPYVVQAGDTVSGIAQRFNSSVQAIIKVNGLDSSGLIFVGQTLLIPVRSGQNQPPTLTPVPTLPGGGTPAGSGTYTVQPGDTLYGIAARFNTTINVLAQLNNIVNPNLIYPGQVLKVPTATTPTPTPATPVPTQPGKHVVQPGENLFRISLKYNVTLDALARANGIYNTSLIYPGQVLIIPGSGTTPQPTPVPTTNQPLTHVVQFGENLFRISLKYNVTLDALMRANGIINPNLVFAGQVLIIPR